MIYLGQILTWRFPAAPDDGFSVQVAADGTYYLAVWREAAMGRPRPKQTEIDSWVLPANKYYQRRAIKRLADMDYDAIFAINGEIMNMYKDRLIIKIARGQALTTAEAANRDQMLAIIQSVQDKVQAINAATTVAQVEGVTWP